MSTILAALVPLIGTVISAALAFRAGARRRLQVIREEAEVVKAMPEGKAKEEMLKALHNSAFQYNWFNRHSNGFRWRRYAFALFATALIATFGRTWLESGDLLTSNMHREFWQDVRDVSRQFTVVGTVLGVYFQFLSFIALDDGVRESYKKDFGNIGRAIAQKVKKHRGS